ncbi:MAG: hypothetical protein ACI85N_000310 [Gammaproteobacteria bacterium]|jgi:hypothetical protein
MLNINLNEKEGIVLLEPEDALSEEDFTAAARIVDPYIGKTGKLNGVIIHVKSFPGWDSFAALIKHLRFVKDHHQKIACVAFATDSPIGELAEHVASHFVNAEIKHFDFNELNEANNWIKASA